MGQWRMVLVIESSEPLVIVIGIELQPSESCGYGDMDRQMLDLMEEWNIYSSLDKPDKLNYNISYYLLDI